MFFFFLRMILWTTGGITQKPMVFGGFNGGTPSSYPFLDEIFGCKSSILKYPHLWKPPFDGIFTYDLVEKLFDIV